MEVLYPRCAGLDVHGGTVTACAQIATGATVTYEPRTVSTTTRGLLDLAEWLTAPGCSHVAMEATGVYWKPVWHVLESHLRLGLANAMHIRNVPGRKSDMNDATWIADLLAHGLIRSSFVPPAPIQELRDLTRTRGRLKATRADLLDALHGRVTDHHRFMIKLHLTQVDALETAVATIEARIGDALGPFRAAVSLLTNMPGLSETTARVLIAEIGTDMTRFPSVGHLISWAGFCPRLDESAGKRRSTRTRQTSPWLKPTLISAAWAATRKKDCYLRAQFLRIKSRRGVAVLSSRSAC
jgi:transposase